MNPVLAATSVALLFLCSCGPAQPTDNDRPEAATDTLPEQNQGNLDIYDVDPDDPYQVGEDNSLLGILPGDAIDRHRDLLREGELRTGDGTFEVFYLDGADGTELGYLLPEPTPDGTEGLTVRSINVTSPRVVTNQGIRVGNTIGELEERLGALDIQGSELESRVHAYDRANRRAYRLDFPDMRRNIPRDEVPDDAQVVYIVLE